MEIILEKIKLNNNFNYEATYFEENEKGDSFKNKNREFLVPAHRDLTLAINDFLWLLRNTIDDFSEHQIRITGIEIKRKESEELGLIIYADKSLPKGLSLEIKTPLIAFKQQTEQDFNKTQRILDTLKSEFVDYAVYGKCQNTQLSLFERSTRVFSAIDEIQELANKHDSSISVVSSEGEVYKSFKPMKAV